MQERSKNDSDISHTIPTTQTTRYDTPIKVTIPVPSEIPRARGLNSTIGYGGNLRIRCTNSDYDLVFEEAIRLGVTPSNFARWCIVETAIAIRRHRETNSRSDTAEKG
jgi:hypothetical protein